MTTQISLKIQVIQAVLMTNDKKKRMKNKEERASRWKYPEPVTYHKHPNSNSNAIGNKENLFQQTRNTFEKMGTSYNNIVKENQIFYRQHVKNIAHERI